VDAVLFGVADMVASRRFLAASGLREIHAAPDRLVAETRDGSEVILVPADAPDLPPPAWPGATLREVVWGAVDAAALKDGLARLGGSGALVAGPDGLPRALDPNGLRLAFRVSRRRHVTVAPTPANAPGNPARIDRRAPSAEGAAPVRIGQLALHAADLDAMRAFYAETMGFVPSDEAPGHAVFLRCRRRGEHHNLLLTTRPGEAGAERLGFALADLHEVMAGGLALARDGWVSAAGPGRRELSSAWAWSFHSPLGLAVELRADDDYCTEAWQPGRFAAGAEAAMWGLAAPAPRLAEEEDDARRP
jgi:catechol 2,3-dioxygenase-like lactoylglutathione lyase family enzyme